MFAHASLSSVFKTGKTAPFIMRSILNVFIKVYMLFISMLVLEKIFGGKQLPVSPPWLHPVCDVAKASLL